MAVFTGNGSVTAPSFTFSSDTNTGIYRVGVDDVGITCGGQATARFYSGGQVLISQEASAPFNSGGTSPGLLVSALTTSGGASIDVSRFQSDASGASITITKSRSGSVGTFGTPVQVGDNLGLFGFYGDDGTTYKAAAQIKAEVSNSVSAGVVPGLLVFSTANLSTGNLQEAFRINAQAQLLVGGATGGNNAPLQIVGESIDYGDRSRVINAAGTFGTAVTNVASGVRSFLSQVSGATVNEMRHFDATENTLLGTITEQMGFYAGGLTTGATNYGFYSNIATASNRWNFYSQGTAPSYFVGDVRSARTFTKTIITANSNVTATATSSSLVNGMRTGTPTAAIDLQLPTGTDLDAEFQDLQANQAFEWSVINLAAATHTITVTANTDSTIVGNAVVDPASSGRFMTRKTGVNTFVTYRIA